MTNRPTMDVLVARARVAQQQLETYSQAQVDRLVRAIGKAVYDNAEILAQEAVSESGYGRVDSKIIKQRKCTVAAWHFLKDKPSVGIIEDDPINQLVTFAKPVGVVAALVPATNPTSTTASNGMNIIKCRNAMIVSPHYRAKSVTRHGVELINAALAELGAPQHLIQVVEEPSMELAQELMQKADVVVATGGASMVKAAYSSGRPSFGVGPGNVQVVVAPDFTDYQLLAQNVIASRAYDNGMPCTGEQAIHLSRDQAPQALEAFLHNGSALLSPDKARQLSALLFRENGVLDPTYVGMTAPELAKLLEVKVPADTQILLFPCLGMDHGNLMRREKLCPVIQYFLYDSFQEGVANARDNLLWEGAGHSAVIYTHDPRYAEYAGEHLPVSRVLVNQQGGAASGGSFTNGLHPTMSLGCGTWGNNSISENLTYRHLMNTTRVAYYHESTLPPFDEVWKD